MILKARIVNERDNFIHVLRISTKCSASRIECNRGGAKQAEKCPVQPSDLVLMRNHIMEALAKQNTEINEDYDFWNAARNLKAPYVKIQ